MGSPFETLLATCYRSRLKKLSIRRNAFVFPGASRGVVLFLAQNRPNPSVAKHFKDGLWEVGRIFYEFFEHSKFTALLS